MEFSNFKCISVVVITSVVLCCVQKNGVVGQKNDESLETILLPRSIHTRHVRRVNKFSQSVTPPIMDVDLSTETQKPLNESDSSDEVDISMETYSNNSSSQPEPLTERIDTVDNHSSSSLELDKMNKSFSELHKVLIDESGFPTQSKPPRAAANTKETVEINEEKDSVKLDDKEDQGSSNLWIYSNAVCILLVVVVSIFLIYYPKKKDPRRACKDSSSSSSESSTSSSSASSMA
ncbi:uncharacterized protein LOC135833864 [Planococcus citri]|uniref:uncharacterized protein LOC135833864 n=1 Tax=Planococcus citri TaxID=170843 RepID=UPI0031F9A6ED